MTVSVALGRAMAGLLASVGITAVPTAAGADTLFDHVDPTPPAAIVSQLVGDAQPQGAIAYDDFTIPPGEVWQLERLFVDGAASGPATSTEAYVQLDRNPGTPPDLTTALYAELLTSGPSATYPDLDLEISQSGAYPPGKYWISARSQLDLGPSSNRWLWQANSEQFGDRPYGRKAAVMAPVAQRSSGPGTPYAYLAPALISPFGSRARAFRPRSTL